jgi:hypothetical protein
MYHHHEPAGYSEAQQDAFGYAGTWQQTPLAIAELSKLDAHVAAYKATGSEAAWDAICDTITEITPALDEIREAVLFDLCTDNDHYDDLADDAIGGEEAAYEYAGVFQ